MAFCGIVHDERYFETEVAPHIDGDRVRYVQRSHTSGDDDAPVSFDAARGIWPEKRWRFDLSLGARF